MDLARVATKLRDVRVLALVLVTNLVGIAYGFYYYVPQFARTPVALWPLVPDSPLAVLLMTLALVGLVLGTSRDWLNLLGAGAMVKVGLWTAFVLVAFADHFGFSFLPVLGCRAGALGCGNLNTILFYGHLGMALEALIVLDRLPATRRAFLAVGGLFVAHDLIDYAWPVDYLGRGCGGVFPHTVPCEGRGLTFVVTLALTVATMAGLYVLGQRARAGEPPP